MLPWYCFVRKRERCDISELGVSVYESSDVGIIRISGGVQYFSFNFKDIQQRFESWVFLWLTMYIILIWNDISTWWCLPQRNLKHSHSTKKCNSLIDKSMIERHFDIDAEPEIRLRCGLWAWKAWSWWRERRELSCGTAELACFQVDQLPHRERWHPLRQKVGSRQAWISSK